MPKLVDHDQRRAELVRAVWEVISRDGIEGATVRKVAEEAGISTGGLRHYFDNQRGLLHFAAQAVASSVSARITEHLRGNLPGADRAQLLLEEFLPLDAGRRVEVDVWMACLARSRANDSMDELRKTSWVGERHICRLAVAYRCGIQPPEDIGDELGDPHLEQRAMRLHVFMDGLTLQAAMYLPELPVEEVRETLRNELDRIVDTTPANSARPH